MTDLTEAQWRQRYDMVQEIFDLAVNVTEGMISPHWFADGQRLWYWRWTDQERELRMVNVDERADRLAAKQSEIADAMKVRLEDDLASKDIVLRQVAVSDDARMVSFSCLDRSWSFAFETKQIEEVDPLPPANWLLSPDGTQALFIRDHNLWIRDLGSRCERALTQDGSEDYPYAMRPAASRTMRRKAAARPEALWSPDSRKILTVQTDDRSVLPLYSVAYVPEDGQRPELIVNRTAFPGDVHVPEFRLLVLDASTGVQTGVRHRRLPTVRMNDTIFGAGLAWWDETGDRAWFVDIERGEQRADFVELDCETGRTRIVCSEESDAYLELGPNVYGEALIRCLPARREIVWYSERSGHGHLYLYSLMTGEVTRVLTHGEWQVRELQHVDLDRRELFFTASGLDPDEDPYHCKLCRVSLDQDGLTVLTPEFGDHRVWKKGDYFLGPAAAFGEDPAQICGISPTGHYFIGTLGKVDALPRHYLKDRDGNTLMELGGPSEATLPDYWQWPEPVKLEAADGQTPVYGLLFRPPGFDPSKRFPIVDIIYGGPQSSHVPKAAFTDGPGGGTYLRAAAFAALGMVVLVLDGRGTAQRGREFRLQSHRAIDTASDLADHVSAIRQLALRYPIDLERVGITGFSGGGYAAALAAFRFGDFFRTVVAASGNYDQAAFWHGWGERYHGPHDADHYASQKVRTSEAGNRPNILFIHGLLDTAVHPIGLFQLLQHLTEANRDYDLVLLPNAAHELPGYGERRRLDYFVRHLLQGKPPEEFVLCLPHERPARPIESVPVKATA